MSLYFIKKKIRLKKKTFNGENMDVYYSCKTYSPVCLLNFMNDRLIGDRDGWGLQWRGPGRIFRACLHGLFEKTERVCEAHQGSERVRCVRETTGSSAAVRHGIRRSEVYSSALE